MDEEDTGGAEEEEGKIINFQSVEVKELPDGSYADPKTGVVMMEVKEKDGEQARYYASSEGKQIWLALRDEANKKKKEEKKKKVS
eukprot:SAG11_NODE_2287_length_3566_cov_541.763773_5_plen_85_part_00